MLDPIWSNTTSTIELAFQLNCFTEVIGPEQQLDNALYFDLDMKARADAKYIRYQLPEFKWSNQDQEDDYFARALCDEYIEPQIEVSDGILP